jgi:hypothetical protein
MGRNNKFLEKLVGWEGRGLAYLGGKMQRL